MYSKNVELISSEPSSQSRVLSNSHLVGMHFESSKHLTLSIEQMGQPSSSVWSSQSSWPSQSNDSWMHCLDLRHFQASSWHLWQSISSDWSWQLTNPSHFWSSWIHFDEFGHFQEFVVLHTQLGSRDRSQQSTKSSGTVMATKKLLAVCSFCCSSCHWQ